MERLHIDIIIAIIFITYIIAVIASIKRSYRVDDHFDLDDEDRKQQTTQNQN